MQETAVEISRFKMRVKEATRDICDPDVAMRYGMQVLTFRECKLTLDQALDWTNAWYRAEKHATSREMAIRYGRIRSRHQLEILRELRLILRLIRRYGHEHYDGIVSFVLSTCKEILANEHKPKKTNAKPAV